MKITDKHRFILSKVRLMSASDGFLGGATIAEISGTDADIVRATRALTKAGYIEVFRTPPAERKTHGGHVSYSSQGFSLFRIGPKGADLLVKEAYENEVQKSLLERVAFWLNGIDPEYVRKAKPTKYLRDGWMDELSAHVSLLGWHKKDS